MTSIGFQSVGHSIKGKGKGVGVSWELQTGPNPSIKFQWIRHSSKRKDKGDGVGSGKLRVE